MLFSTRIQISIPSRKLPPACVHCCYESGFWNVAPAGGARLRGRMPLSDLKHQSCWLAITRPSSLGRRVEPHCRRNMLRGPRNNILFECWCCQACRKAAITIAKIDLITVYVVTRQMRQEYARAAQASCSRTRRLSDASNSSVGHERPVSGCWKSSSQFSGRLKIMLKLQDSLNSQ